MSELPIDTAADVEELRATEAFTLLGSETRLAILLALWEADELFDDGPPNPSERQALSFSELRERVDYDTSSNFSYHLDQLLGSFVRKTDEGYELLPAGDNIVHAIVASAGFVDRTVPPMEVELNCPRCDASTAITYQNQRLFHVCCECEGLFDLDGSHPRGTLGGWISNPAILDRGTAEDIHTAVRTEVYHLFAMRAAGICPKCSGRVAWSLHVCDDHDPGPDGACQRCQRKFQSVAEFACEACKNVGIIGVSSLALRHPAVIGFFWDHGIALGYDANDTARRLLEFDDVETEVISNEPPRVRVSICLQDDVIGLTYDESLEVVEVTEDKRSVQESEVASNP